MNKEEYNKHCLKVLSVITYKGNIYNRMGLIICPESDDPFLDISICNKCNNKQRCIAYQ